ncbi:MAG: hypothetical protein RLZZ325_574 [Pseudomonadota bacterium]
MAKMQTKIQSEERDDGLREKMIAVNRVTKVVLEWAKGNRRKFQSLFKRLWTKLAAK